MLILGAGPTGICTLQCALLKDPGLVMICEKDPLRLDFLRRHYPQVRAVTPEELPALLADLCPHGGADGGGRLGKADDQPGLRVLGGHLVPQGTHHLQSRRGAHRDVLGLQGIDQQVAPLGVVVSLGDPQRVCGRIWVHCGTLPSSCHEIVVRL